MVASVVSFIKLIGLHQPTKQYDLRSDAYYTTCKVQDPDYTYLESWRPHGGGLPLAARCRLPIPLSSKTAYTKNFTSDPENIAPKNEP